MCTSPAGASIQYGILLWASMSPGTGTDPVELERVLRLARCEGLGAGQLPRVLATMVNDRWLAVDDEGRYHLTVEGAAAMAQLERADQARASLRNPLE